jgi:hypothetical protein
MIYSKNACTTLTRYIDQFAFVTEQWKKAVEAHQAQDRNFCEFCNEVKPTEFYNACPLHKACNKCHATPSMLCRRGGSMCKIAGCTHQIAPQPLQRDLHAEKMAKLHAQVTEDMRFAFDNDQTKNEESKAALREAKNAAAAEKVRADAAASLAASEKLRADAAEAAAAAAAAAAAEAPPRRTGGGRAAMDDLTPEEQEERMFKKAEAARKRAETKRKLAEHGELVEQCAELERALKRAKRVESAFEAVKRVGLSEAQTWAAEKAARADAESSADEASEAESSDAEMLD